MTVAEARRLKQTESELRKQLSNRQREHNQALAEQTDEFRREQARTAHLEKQFQRLEQQLADSQEHVEELEARRDEVISPVAVESHAPGATTVAEALDSPEGRLAIRQRAYSIAGSELHEVALRVKQMLSDDLPPLHVIETLKQEDALDPLVRRLLLEVCEQLENWVLKLRELLDASTDHDRGLLPGQGRFQDLF